MFAYLAVSSAGSKVMSARSIRAAAPHKTGDVGPERTDQRRAHAQRGQWNMPGVGRPSAARGDDLDHLAQRQVFGPADVKSRAPEVAVGHRKFDEAGNIPN